jgi:hypothetical protein
MFFPSSHVLQPNLYLQGTTAQPFLHFWAPPFSLGPAALPFHQTHFEHLRATNAMEQVLLALFVGKTHRVMTRLFSSGGGPGSTSSLGVPARLKD